MSEWTTADLRIQLQRLRAIGHLALFQRSATRAGILLPLWLAIASRETNCQNMLGDRRGGEFHGVGYVQVDVQHPEARAARDSGSWRGQPGQLLAVGAGILMECRRVVRAALPELVADALWKVATSAYNCGPENALRGHAEHGDSDHETTGGDYGKDVIARAGEFDRLLR